MITKNKIYFSVILITISVVILLFTFGVPEKRSYRKSEDNGAISKTVSKTKISKRIKARVRKRIKKFWRKYHNILCRSPKYNPTWTIIIDGPGPAEDYAQGISVTPSGNSIYVIGKQGTGTLEPFSSYSEYWIAKFDKCGDLVWEKFSSEFEFIPTNSFGRECDIVVDEEDEFVYAIGSYYDGEYEEIEPYNEYYQNIPHTRYSTFIVKLNTRDGSTAWSTNIVGAVGHGIDISALSVFVTGSKQKIIETPVGNRLGKDKFFARFRPSDAEPLGFNTYDSVSDDTYLIERVTNDPYYPYLPLLHDEGNDIILHPNGDAYITGTSSVEVRTYDKTLGFQSYIDNALWVARVRGGNGALVWDSGCPSPSMGNDITYERDDRQDVWIIGRYGDDIGIVAFTQDGAFVLASEERYNGPGNGPDGGYGIVGLQDGGLAMTGYESVEEIGTNVYDKHIWVRTDRTDRTPRFMDSVLGAGFQFNTGYAIDTDSRGYIYVAGVISALDYRRPGNDYGDIWIRKYTPSGSTTE